MKNRPKTNLILRLIRDKCRSEKILQKNVCLGLCDPAYISRCCNRNIEMDKLMLDAIMQRLGMSTRNYEYILREGDYKCFEMREKIRMCIQNDRIDEAEQLLQQYQEMQEDIKGVRKMHHQGALLLGSYILVRKNVDLEIQLERVEEAILCTFPKDYEKRLDKLLFGEMELLLLTRRALLLEQMERKEEAYALYYKLYLRQLEKPYNNGELIHVFAVVDYHLSKLCYERKEYHLANKVASEGVKTLSRENKILFAAELLEMCEMTEEYSEQKRDPEEERCNYHAIKRIIVKYMPDWDADTYFPMYREYGVYSFRKMLVQRRKLLGLTQDSFSERCFCDKVTIERLEQGLTNTQWDIGYDILNELGLPIEQCFSLFQTDSYEVKRTARQFDRELNQGNLDAAEKLLEQLEEKIDLNYISNKQMIELNKLLLRCRKEDVDVHEKLERLKEILRYTLRDDFYKKRDDVILYASEIEVFCNMIGCYEDLGESKYVVGLLEKIIEGYNDRNVIGEENLLNNLVFSRLQESALANIGDFENSNKIVSLYLDKVVEHNLAGMTEALLYDRVWNKKEFKQILNEYDYEDLECALSIAVFRKNKKLVNIINKMVIDIKK